MCPLCLSSSVRALPRFTDGRSYLHCATCDLRFLDPDQRLDPQAERERYLLHTASFGDEGYRRFVEPLLASVRKNTGPGGRGLDYGSGHIPVLTHWLREFGYAMTTFDVFFHPDREVLKSNYDFVVACEVIEHFYRPAEEFSLLASLLPPHGHMYLQTDVYRDHMDFETWYYRRDPTHVAFYSERSFRWLASAFDFAGVSIQGRVICLGRAVL